jgi:hypothetical protein
MSVHAFPRGRGVDPSPSTCDSFNVCTFITSWPKYGIYTGYLGVIRRGRGELGKPIQFEYEGARFLARLIYRDADGNIGVCDSLGEVALLKKGEYKIIGTLVKVYSGPEVVK